MRYRYITATLILIAATLQATAQALTDRYNNGRPVVVACDKDLRPYTFTDDRGLPAGTYIDITNAVADRLGVPCTFLMKEGAAAREAFERGHADLLLESDAIAGIRFTGRDRQLTDQIEDQYMRLKENGDIAAIQERWLHPERVKTEAAPIVLTVAVILLLAALIWLAILLARQHKTADQCRELKEMTDRAKAMEKFYAMEDTPAAHDLLHKYEAILCTPYLAIAFYDYNGKLIAENEAMKQLGDTSVASRRQLLYDAKGKVANYFVAIPRPRTMV